MANSPQISRVTSISPNETSIRVPVTIFTRGKAITLRALIDSGAEGTFINSTVIEKNKLDQQNLEQPIIVKNVDGTTNKAKEITGYILAFLQAGERPEATKFLITAIGNEDIILGLPWLRRNNPSINWAANTVQINRTEVTETFPEPVEKPALVIPEYCKQWTHVFDKKAAERFPPSREYDHAIQLKPDFKPQDCKVYSMTAKEYKVLDEFLEENLRKGYIRTSNSPQASPFFFVPKKDPNDLRPCQDYRVLNAGTIPDRSPLPLVSDLLDTLKNAKYFTKLDLRNGYNNIRIKKGDE